ncbi:MAG: RepB family plasmid replication initiator protein [Pseudomonadota bacterium]
MATEQAAMATEQAAKATEQAAKAPTPYQLSLFYYDVTERYSNVVHLYHEIPKYVCGAPRDQVHLDSIERIFKVDEVEYRVVLHPARIKVPDKNGVMVGTKELFIGSREELVEDAILKIAIEKRRLYSMAKANTTQVRVTVYEIQCELKKTNHLYSYDEIKEAIQVLGNAKMIIEEVGGEAKWGSSTYPEFMLSTDSRQQPGFVQLHPLMAEGIKRGQFSQYDYTLAMSLPGRYARRLYKVLAAKFTWARTGGEPYTIYLNSFLSKHGFKLYDRITDNAKFFRQSLESLQQARIIAKWVEKKPKRVGRRISDFSYELHAHPAFGLAMKRSQGIKTEIQAKLEPPSKPQADLHDY